MSACNFAVELDERQLCDVELLMQGKYCLMYTYIYTCKYVYENIHIYIYICLQVYKDICIYVLTQIYIHAMRIYIYIYMYRVIP
jgi:hypothetical protein